MVVHTYFGQIPSEFIFASPKVGKSFHEPLESGIAQIRKFLIDERIDCEVSLLANESFRTEVLLPTVERSSATADGSELFLRSYRLWRLFEKEKAVIFDTTQTDISSPAPPALPIEFVPADTQEFKNRLLNCRKALIIVEYANGTSKRNDWNAEKFTEQSNLGDYPDLD